MHNMQLTYAHDRKDYTRKSTRHTHTENTLQFSAIPKTHRCRGRGRVGKCPPTFTRAYVSVIAYRIVLL